MAARGSSVAASLGPVDHVEVLRFTLVKAYRADRFAAAAHELDGTITRIAAQMAGHVVSRATVALASRRARSYRIDYGAGRTEEIAFVLDGRTEYELLCRRRVAEPNGPCRLLFSSFALG